MAKQQGASDKNVLDLEKVFKFYDLNGDGVISRDELHSYFKSDKIVDEIVARLDKNGDGLISYAEFYGEVSQIKDGEATLQRVLEKYPLTTAVVTATYDKASKTLSLQNNKVPMTCASNVDEKLIEKLFQYGPFVEWMANINRIENPDPARPELIVDKVHIQQIDMFGPKIGFVKFEVAARKWNEKMNQVAFVPGIVFMRGGAVGILCILVEVETNDEYALITLQPRIPAGFSDFAEIPAGMLDGEPHNQKFAGKAAKEMSEETLLEIKESELFDLTNFAYGKKYHGMYPSAGGCDEFLKLFLYRRYMSRDAMELLRAANAGDDASEIIKIKLVPLDDLWKEAPDAKALSALYLYERFLKAKINHPPTPRNIAQEAQLKSLLKPKIEQHRTRHARTTTTHSTK